MITTSIWPGNAKEKRGDLDGAIADYNQAIKLNPNYCIAYNNRGILRQMKGDLSGAMADFTLAQIIRSSSGSPGDWLILKALFGINTIPCIALGDRWTFQISQFSAQTDKIG